MSSPKIDRKTSYDVTDYRCESDVILGLYISIFIIHCSAPRVTLIIIQPLRKLCYLGEGFISNSLPKTSDRYDNT